jgi:hypothetical protein
LLNCNEKIKKKKEDRWNIFALKDEADNGEPLQQINKTNNQE